MRGDVDLCNVDLFGRAVLSDLAIHVQHFWGDLGSAPMRAQVDQPLHNWIGQLPLWLTCFGWAASVQQGSDHKHTNMNSPVMRVSTCRRICLGRFLGGGSQTRGWPPTGSGEDGATDLTWRGVGMNVWMCAEFLFA